MFKTKWTHASVELIESQQKILEWEIIDISNQLDKADDLIFHTVQLTDDENGPIVIVNSQEGCDDTLFLTYYENLKWTKTDALKDI